MHTLPDRRGTYRGRKICMESLPERLQVKDASSGWMGYSTQTGEHFITNTCQIGFTR